MAFKFIRVKKIEKFSFLNEKQILVSKHIDEEDR